VPAVTVITRLSGSSVSLHGRNLTNEKYDNTRLYPALLLRHSSTEWRDGLLLNH